MKFITEQEKFWAGKFGNHYIDRNQGENLLASNINFFSKSLNAATKINSCIEFGANIGMNLKALKYLYPDIELHGIEINKEAAEILSKTIDSKYIINQSIFDYEADNAFDLALIKGVLIHINQNKLELVYEKLIKSTNRYLLVAEYYNPSPVTVKYRGHDDRLFKRDFAGEIMNLYSEMKLIDYGFVYKNDPVFPLDDITWFLLEKN